uniref:Tf2-1-like SH3-like domain-containing protein n=1 Tax=Asparagus officinalis TaxID=4686 RepID=Q2A9Z1_ASPOF|nr:hypothetical protein 20.t00034 [Asparagus officinalis]
MECLLRLLASNLLSVDDPTVSYLVGIMNFCGKFDLGKERLKGEEKKSKPIRYGPFQILDQIDDNAFRLDLPPYLGIYSRGAAERILYFGAEDDHDDAGDEGVVSHWTSRFLKGGPMIRVYLLFGKLAILIRSVRIDDSHGILRIETWKKSSGEATSKTTGKNRKKGAGSSAVDRESATVDRERARSSRGAESEGYRPQYPGRPPWSTAS